jgi:prephenate dehydrogenase
MRFERVTIIGVGLMGGSLGMALRQRGLAGSVLGVDANAQTLKEAQRLGAIEGGTTDLAAGVREADFLVFAAPVGMIPNLLAAAAAHVRPDALVTDLGSVKKSIVASGTRLFGTRFVGGHPMAGSERSGPEAARADLFEDAAWAIVRPESFRLETDEPAQRLAELVRAVGAEPIALDTAQHDRLVALVSHLPHALSFAFARTAGSDAEADLARTLAAGSYRDLIRVSRADPGLWRDIFLDNRDALLAALTAFEERLRTLRTSIEAGDAEGLREALNPL